ncbi:type I methionyl aminopeptidase [Haloplasma contractile]|uniref:Methionine aminopeptidase n=1 Tax=Haloplasma contractile SSD-17B TaxID=1033810 RepID=U2EC52_9MOLU|nr:type I methionyl aminopeptidase [Haloplasma contractile]ERJ12366.1 Methionine aminopeptidase protein [Haloplasma contractile SSD-17B]
MIICKTQREIDIMREAGRIVAIAHNELKKHIKPGITTLELDQIVEDLITSHNATPSFKGYNGFPGSICVSINEELVHGIPSKRKLKDGDIISIDIGAYYKGYHGDSAWTYPVGTISQESQRLLDVTEQSLFKGLAEAKPGNRLQDISHAIQKYAEDNGYTIVREFVGHGVGQELHEDPAIPNFGKPGKGPRLKKGMTLAIEPMVNQGERYVKMLPDNWTVITADKKLCAHFEHTIVILDDGYEILTQL